MCAVAERKEILEKLKDCSYYLHTLLTQWVVALAVDRRVLGRERVPRKGPFVLVANHISHFDPPLIGSPLWRRINWVTASDLYVHPMISLLFDSLGCIRFDRGRRDQQAIKTMLSSLRSGRPVGIFPEGGIRHGQRSVLCGAPMDPSAWLLAWQARVPVVNAVIIGTDALYAWSSWPKFRPVFVGYSSAIEPQRFCGFGDSRIWRERFVSACRESFEHLLQEMRKRWEIDDTMLPKSAQEHWAAEEPHARFLYE